MTKQCFVVLLLTLGTLCAQAQTEATQYFMTSLPQVSINNPAFLPRYNFSIGLPVISSIATGYSNSGFSYNDLITRSNGEVKADLSKWVKALTEKNYITTSTHFDLLRVGFRINPKLYLQISATAHQYARLQIPKEFASLFVQGTAPLIGTSAHFSPQGEGIAYIESAAGAAYRVDEKLTLGTRVKYLSGMANVSTVSSSMNVAVGSDYQLTASADLNLKTSGIQDPDHATRNAFSNTGFAIDLGGTYKLTEKLTVAASLIDLGKITWKKNLYSYTLDKNTASYTFSGIDLKEVVNGNTNYFHDQLDSIQDKFKLQENKIGSYRTWLPGKMYLSGNYELVKNLSLGALFFTEKFQGRVASGGSASVNKHFGNWASASVSYTVSNRSYNNFGLGISFNLSPFQLFIVGDNLLRIPVSLITTQQLNAYINSSQVFNLRMGLNFVWGRDKSLDRPSRNTKSYNSKTKGTKEKVTDGNADYLKVRKKNR